MIFGRRTSTQRTTNAPTASDGNDARAHEAEPTQDTARHRTPSGTTAALETAGPAPHTPGSRRLSHLWSDGLGTAGTRALQVILVIVLAAAAVFAMTRLSLVVLPVLLGVILACALWPLVRLLRRWMSPLLAAWVVLLGAFVVLGGIITGIVTSVVSQWADLSAKAQEGFTQVQGWVKDLPFSVSQTQIDEWLQKGVQFVTSSQFGAGALSGLSAAGNFFVGLGTLLVVLFFFLKDGDRMWSFGMSWIPERVRPTWDLSGLRAQQVFGGYVRGTSVVAAVDAVGIGLVMAIVGVPLAFPLAILVFLGGFIPMVGATVAGVISVLVTLVSTGLWQAVAVAIGTIVVQQLEGNLLQPVVMGNTLRLHGLVILLTLTGGSVLGGIVGALISVPLVAAVWAVVKVCTGRETAEDDPAERKRRKRVRKQAKKRAKALAG